MAYLGKVVSGFLRQGDKFLVGLRPKHKAAPDLVEFVGGKVDPTDKTLEEALKREYLEETGLTIKVKDLMWDSVLCFPDGSWHIHMFEVEILSGEPECKVHQWLKWLTWEEMQKHNMAPSLKKVMEEYISKGV